MADKLEERRFIIRVEPPFRFDMTARVLKRRPENLVDGWDGTTYRRVFAVDGGRLVSIAVVAVDGGVEVAVRGPGLTDDDVDAVRGVVTRTFGLSTDLSGFKRIAEVDPVLGELYRGFEGVRPPRFPTLLEACVNAVACQQLTLTYGMTIVSRLCVRYGVSIDSQFLFHGQFAHAFPESEALAVADPAEIKGLGYSSAKARSIVEIAGEVAGGRLREDEFGDLDDADALARLRRLRGIGRWTGEYILLRGLGRLDVFPADDAGGRNNLMRWLGRAEKLDYDAIQNLLMPWKPYRGLMFILLMLRRLSDSGAA
jgi:DNA-3-methyladenine glycosylase II